jgi:tRNA A-37 threonylcarbamoyl transferase component Bud32
MTLLVGAGRLYPMQVHSDLRNESRLTSRIRREHRGGETVYCKEYLEGDWGRTDAVVRGRTEREVRLVDRLHASGAFDRRLGLIRIVSADPEHGCLVTAEVPGRTLERLIRERHRSGRVEQQRAMLLAGRWLRQFQPIELNADDRNPISELDPDDLVAYCRVRLSTLEGHRGRRPSPKMVDRLLRRVGALVNQSDESDRRMVWAHADYTLGNMIWDGHRLTPIDFAMAHADRPLLDVTYFIHRLQMLRVYRPWRRLPIAMWKRAFLRGYGRPDAEQSPMYQALMIRHRICRLHAYARRTPRDWKQAVHDRYVMWWLRRGLAREAAKSA